MPRPPAALTEQLADTVLVIGTDGRICYANPAASRLFGRSRGALVGMEFGYPLTPGGTTRIQILRPDGSLRHVSMRTLPTLWKAEPAIIASLHDVTESVEEQRAVTHLTQAEHLGSLGNVMQGIAHELNNPTTQITLNLHHIESTADAIDALLAAPNDGTREAVALILEDLRERVQQSHGSVAQISSVLDDIQLFGLIESQSREVVSINSLARTVRNLTQSQLPDGVALTLTVGEPLSTLAHPNQLCQTLVALTLRIARLTPSYTTLHMRTSSQDGRACITLSAPEIHLSDNELKLLFTPFTTKSSQKDVGRLGLTLVAESVALLDGTLDATCTARDGLAIEVQFETYEVPAPDPSTQRPALDDEGRRPRTLLIDDDAIIRSALKHVLKGVYDVTAAGDGETALDLLEQGERFDVILCDLMMPRMDGVTFYRRLRARWPELCQRVIFVSGGAFNTTTRNFLQDHDVLMLEKPFSVKDLKQLMAQRASIFSSALEDEP